MFKVNQVAVDSDMSVLMECFKDEPVLKGVVEALQGISMGLYLCECKRAHHCAVNYMIEGQKLWYVGSVTPMRAITQKECVTQKEAVELAQLEHEAGGHFHFDMIKIVLLHKI